MLLIECLVYVLVFAILLGGATTVFYFCWDHSRAVIFTADDIASALHAGERWRADVRAATGKITVETSATGEVARIPEGARMVSYRFESGRSQPPDFHAGQSASAAGEGQNIGNETGRAGRRQRVALGSGIAPAPQGSESAAAVHVRGGGPGKTMKIQPDNFKRGPGAPKRSEDGMATLVFIALLAIMMILVTAESSALFHLHREVNFWNSSRSSGWTPRRPIPLPRQNRNQNERRRRQNPDDQKLDKVLCLRAAGLVAGHWPAVRARGVVDFRPGPE